jgi:transcriptional regulator with XRE-family HTH domain
MLFMNRIRELREAQNLTQEALGERIGTSGSNMSKLERFDEKLDLPKMRAIARAIDRAAVDLLADEDNPYRLTTQEWELVQLFRALNDKGKIRFIRIATAIAEPIGPEAA